MPKATYYNFQLHRRVGGRWVKVLTRWPEKGMRVRRGAPTTFAWEAVPKASYYNFQLHRRIGGRWVKVLTRWPGKPWFALPRRWQAADGTASTLTAGRYRWYVWPATGLRSQRRYGKLEGSSEFSVG